jgi:hypothetical protein
MSRVFYAATERLNSPQRCREEASCLSIRGWRTRPDGFFVGMYATHAETSGEAILRINFRRSTNRRRAAHACATRVHGAEFVTAPARLPSIDA